MKPDPSTYNPSPDNLKDLIRRTKLSNPEFALECGIEYRTLMNWLAALHQFNYRDQFTMEALAKYKESEQ